MLQRIINPFKLINIPSPAILGFTKQICTSGLLCKAEDKREMRASLPVKDEGTLGEKSIDIDSIISTYI